MNVNLKRPQPLQANAMLALQQSGKQGDLVCYSDLERREGEKGGTKMASVVLKPNPVLLRGIKALKKKDNNKTKQKTKSPETPLSGKSLAHPEHASWKVLACPWL